MTRLRQDRIVEHRWECPISKKAPSIEWRFLFYLVGSAGLATATNRLKVIFVLQKYSFINSV
jgi:hypothetical protein